MNVGQRQGVCRDFAVLGYCERGLDCDRQHVRECPDFAEKGACGTKGCKLPHVIRANRNRKVAGISTTASAEEKMNVEAVTVAGSDSVVLTAEDGQLGDEYISLTFKESDSEDEEESESGTESDTDDEEDESMMNVNM